MNEQVIPDNSMTLSSYEAHIEEYLAGTPQEVTGHVKAWIDAAVAEMPSNGSVLELGSAFGRDAAYLESLGCQVDRTDATEGFVKLLQKLGHTARVLNALSDDYGGPYGMIFADAVLLHFTPVETATVLNKAYESLSQDGILAFTVKKGNGQVWSDEKLNAPRYFYYWQPDDLRVLINNAHFEHIEIGEAASNETEWLMVTAKKVAGL